VRFTSGPNVAAATLLGTLGVDHPIARGLYREGEAGTFLDAQAWKERVRREKRQQLDRAEREAARSAAGLPLAPPSTFVEARRAVVDLGYRAAKATTVEEFERFQRAAFAHVSEARPADRDRLWGEYQRARWLARVEAITAHHRAEKAAHLLELERAQRRDRVRNEHSRRVLDVMEALVERRWCRLDWAHPDRKDRPFRRRAARALRGLALAEPDRLVELGMDILGDDENPDEDAPVRAALEKVARHCRDLEVRVRTEAAAREKNKWHTSRAKGVKARYHKTATCGQTASLVLTCKVCGDKRSIPLGCDNRLICPVCRKKQASEYRRTAVRAIKGICRAVDSAGLLYEWTDRGVRSPAHARNAARDKRRHKDTPKFFEKMITFGVPHFDDDSVADRLDRLHRAWPHFLKSLNAWQRDQFVHNEPVEVKAPDGRVIVRPADLCAHVGAIEWTAGSDGLGNPHRHVWHLGPFLPHKLVLEWLKDAYLKVCQKCRDAWLKDPEKSTTAQVIPVRNGYTEALNSADPGFGRTGSRTKVELELFKYLIKDWTESIDGERIDPEVMATVVSWHDGKRLRQASSGLFRHWKILLFRVMPCCGHRVSPDVRIEHHDGCDHATPRPERGDAWEPPGEPALPSLPPRESSQYDKLRDAYDAGWIRRLDEAHPGAERQLGSLRSTLAAMGVTPARTPELDSQPRGIQTLLWGADDGGTDR